MNAVCRMKKLNTPKKPIGLDSIEALMKIAIIVIIAGGVTPINRIIYRKRLSE